MSLDKRTFIEVSDPGDPRLEDYRNLRGGPTGAKPRERSAQHVVIEGHLALERTVGGPLRLRSVLMTPRRTRSTAELLAMLDPGVPLYVAERAVIAEVAGFDVHRGTLASAERPDPLDAAALLAEQPRVVVLAGLTDLENVGAAFRVAAGLRFGAVLLDRGCADPLYRRCIRVSLGWSTVIPHAFLAMDGERVSLDDPAVLRGGLLGRAGHRTVALTPHGPSVAVDVAARNGLLDDPLAVLVGAEGAGLSAAVLDSAEHRVCIPMAEGVDSLNAATALAVVASFGAARRGWR